MKKYLQLVAVLVALLPLGGCVTGAVERSGDRQPNLISAEEIEAAPASTAFEAVQALRPQWLRQRGPQNVRPTASEEGLSGGDVVVYLNGSRVGGLAELHNISLVGITSMRFLDAPQATQRWGTGHTHGAIVVSTDAGGRR